MTRTHSCLRALSDFDDLLDLGDGAIAGAAAACSPLRAPDALLGRGDRFLCEPDPLLVRYDRCFWEPEPFLRELDALLGDFDPLEGFDLFLGDPDPLRWEPIIGGSGYAEPE